NIHTAKRHLSRLLEAAAAGEEVIITKRGKPLARLGPLPQPRGKRVLGRLRGKIVVLDDFDAPLPDEVLDLFEKC
ncbi:MAG TPA: type II toxin-antitoxin system prevent-host-death family antitoxin, partial [Stellaceae bacterium]|nr:type II toxin-antitoxin system prevent-host-death family antitoxin [Stellaceae bacterium]